MRKLGFDNEKYLAMQSDHIRKRISQFGDKLYLEFGGKLFDDYHASRVLPGFEPDSKLRMLMQLADQAGDGLLTLLHGQKAEPDLLFCPLGTGVLRQGIVI